MLNKLFHLILIAVIFSPSTISAEQMQQLPTSAATGIKKLLQLPLAELELVEGVGFRKARIGAPIANIIKRIAKPVTIRKLGLLTKDVAITYQFDASTLVVLNSTKGRLNKIVITGLPASAFHTRYGARFGMKARTIIALYNHYPKKIKNNKINIPQLATRFWFTNGLLSKIVVYKHKNRR